MGNLFSWKAFGPVVALIGLVCGAMTGFAADEDKELKKMEGDWTVVRAEQSGTEMRSKELKTMRVTIRGKTMTIHFGERQEVVNLTVDGNKKPKQVDFRPEKFNNKQLDRGIYEWAEDQLTFCWGGAKTPEGRTEAFKTTEGGGERLLVLKRAGKNPQ